MDGTLVVCLLDGYGNQVIGEKGGRADRNYWKSRDEEEEEEEQEERDGNDPDDGGGGAGCRVLAISPAGPGLVVRQSVSKTANLIWKTRCPIQSIGGQFSFSLGLLTWSDCRG